MSQKTTERSLGRRQFLNMAGLGAAALLVSPRFSFAEGLSDRKIRMAIVGGGFGASFYFHEHPNCTVEAVSDLRADRREILMKTYKCAKSYESLEKLVLDPKVEAVFIATAAPDHAKHVLTALNAGKHVLCAVPAAWTLEECAQIRNTVKRTGLSYMMAETSYFRQNAISVRKMYAEGKFGTIFSSAAEYYHPTDENSPLLFEPDGKPSWRYGIPPMQYPTHCTSFLISVTGERLTSVSCLGWGDKSKMLTTNHYKNPFCNETAFFQTNKGNPFRVEVNWRGALRDVERAEWRGTKMSFYSGYGDGDGSTIVRQVNKAGVDQGGYANLENVVEKYEQPVWWKTDMLPKALQHDSYHDGAHTFLTHEFIDALVNNRQPAINVHEALAYTAPGIVAHQSALKGGEFMKIPGFD